MSANAPQPDTDELKRMISKFRVHELQCLLIYAGKSKNGKKQELYDRVMVLFENNAVLPAPLRIKIQDLYAKFMATQPCWVRMPSTSPENFSHSSVNEPNYMQSSSLNKSNYPSYQPCGSRPSQNYTVAFAPSYGNHTSYRSLINASNTNRTNLRILTQQQNNNSMSTANTQNSRQNRFADYHHQQQNLNPGPVHYPHQNGPSMHASSAVNRSSSQHHSNINSQTRVVFERGSNANNRPILINNNNTQSSVLYNSNNNNIVVSNVPLNSQNPNNQNGAGMQQTKMSSAVFNPKSYVVQPTGVNLKPLPFYEPICDLIKPTTLIPYNVEKGGPQETFFMFHLTPKMVEEILTSRFKCPLTGKEDYGTQIQLRFCIYNEEIINCPQNQNQNQTPNVNHKSGNYKIKKSLPETSNNKNFQTTTNNENEDEFCLDNLPTNICIKVNGFPAPLPLALPPKPPSTEPRRPGRPINLTSLVKLSPMIENHLNISWTLSYSQNADNSKNVGNSSTAITQQNLVVHIMALYLVKKFTTQALLNRLLIKPHIKQIVTKNLVKQKLKCVSDDIDDEIATTCVGVSLLCPLSKSRINYPSRAHSCDHFQCFDAVSYLSMNEKNAKWTCPICYKSAPYETLAIDTFFLNILTTCPSTVREIELNADSSWKAISENSSSINSQSNTSANTLNKRKQPSHCNTTMGNNTQQCNKKLLNNFNLDPSSTIEIIEDELLCSNEGQELLENTNEKNDKSNNAKNWNIPAKNTANSLNCATKYTTEGGTGHTATFSQDEGHDSDIVILSSSSEEDETTNHQPLAPAKNSHANQEKNGKIPEKNLQQPLIKSTTKSATLNENSQLNLAVNAKENDGETIINKASNMGHINEELESCVMNNAFMVSTSNTNQETQSLDTTTSQHLTGTTTKSLESQQISSSESIETNIATISKSPFTTEIDSLPVTSVLAEEIICSNTINLQNPLKEPSNMSILASNTTTVVHSRLKRLRQCLNALDDNHQNENDDTFETEQRTNNLPTTEKNDDNINSPSSEKSTNNSTNASQNKQNNQVKKHRKPTNQRIQSPPSNLETQLKTNANHDATTLPKANNNKKHKPQKDSSDDSECEIINICSPLESQPNVTQSLSSLISSAVDNSPIFSGPLSQTSSLLSYQIPKKIARKVDEKCSELLIAQMGKTKSQTNIGISQHPSPLTNLPTSPMKSITSAINLSVSGIYGGAYTVSTLNSLDINCNKNDNNDDKSILTTNKENSLVEPMDYINNSDNLKTHANISLQNIGKQVIPISNANIDYDTTSTFFSGYSNESSNHDTLFEKMAQINAKKVQELLKINPFLTIPSGTLPSSILQKSVSNSTQHETNNLTPLKNNSSPTKNIFSSNFTTNLSLTNVTSHDAVSNIFQSNYNNFTSNVDNITPQLPLTSLSTNIFKDMAESTNQQQSESSDTKSPDKNPKVNSQNVRRQNVFDALLTSNTSYSSVSANSLLSNLSNSLLPSINNQAQNSLNHNNSTSGLLKSSTLKSLFPPSSSSMMSRNNDYGTCLDLATFAPLNQPLVDSQAPSSFNEISTDRNAQLYTRSPSLTHQKFICAVSSALENQRRHSLNPQQQQSLQQLNNGNNNLFHSNFEDYQHKETTSLPLSSPHNNNSFMPLPPPLKAITGRGFPSSPKDKTSLMGLVGPNLMENIFQTKTITQSNSFGVEGRSVNQQRTSMVNGITTINQSCSNNIFLSSQHSLESSYNNIPTTISSNSSKTTTYHNRPNNFMTPRK